MHVHVCIHEYCHSHHSKEIVVVSDFGGIFVELLVKGVRNVVGGVSGYEQDTLPDPGQQHSQARTGQGRGGQGWDVGRGQQGTHTGTYMYMYNILL